MNNDSNGMNEEEEAGYFDEVMDAVNGDNGGQYTDKMFSELSLSRPLLRAVEAMGYITPTPIQSAVIPLAMAGRDVCASAVTGSGKTAAFSLPFLERLLFRRKDIAAIRVLVVSPTRELATQTYQVLQKLTQFTDITSALICGGKKDVKSQEATLRLRPDVVICTPGRLIDHLRNSRSVNIDDLDVLVLDEVGCKGMGH
jgi:ATP-dependent RNA helicase DDX27